MRRVVFVCLTAALLAGCSAPRPAPIVEEKKEAEGEANGKKEEPPDDGKGPHGGVIAAWSSDRTQNNFHVEICIDRGKAEVSVYVLADDARMDAPIEADQLLLTMRSPPFEVVLRAAPQANDPAKKSSRFVGARAQLGAAHPFEGSVSGKVGGELFSGDFGEEAPK